MAMQKNYSGFRPFLAALIAVVFMAGCTTPTTNDKKQDQYVTQPDKVMANLSAYKGCSAIISESELSDATTWSAQDTSFSSDILIGATQ